MKFNLLIEIIFLLPTLIFCDIKCESQSESIKTLISSGIKNFTFDSSTRNAIEMTWAGDNSGILIVAIVEELETIFGSIIKPSLVYKISNAGTKPENITNQFSKDPIIIPLKFGLQRHLYDKTTIYILAIQKLNLQSVLYLTTDQGEHWSNHTLDFRISGPIVPNDKNINHLLYLDPNTNKLHLSQDKGRTWKKIRDDVKQFYWQDVSAQETAIYVLCSTYTSPSKRVQSLNDLFKKLFGGNTGGYSLKETFHKSSDLGKNWILPVENVHDLKVKGRYIYIAVEDEKNRNTRRIKVSTDDAKTWNHVQLPSFTPDRFFDILDIEEEFVFLHVDEPMDTGKGVLYTSDKTGIIFSESLRNHLYPNHISQSDFFKVESMSGTYIASVINTDNTVSTVITHNRGATWTTIPKPADIPCPPGENNCGLHLMSNYGLQSNLIGRPPMSAPNAIGIILAHGHVNMVQKTLPSNIFVSSDGGYNWAKALSGPHDYKIADHGGLLVALPITTSNPNVIKFSTDEGRCWHEVIFTHKSSIDVRQLIVEPGNKAMTVTIWGYDKAEKKWILFNIDFSKYVTRDCLKKDYEIWTAHQQLKGKNAVSEEGCYLGLKRKYRRLKLDSFCRNGYSYGIKSDTTPCKCTKSDYECEYGYSRPVNSLECVKDANIMELDVCIAGNREKIITDGYRKVPGDLCVGGFTPQKESQQLLNKKCNATMNLFGLEQVSQKQASKQVSGPNSLQSVAKKSNSVAVGLVTTALIAIILALSVIVFVLYRRTKTPQTLLHYNILDVRQDDDALLVAEEDIDDREADTSRLIHGEMNSNSNRGFSDNQDVGLINA